AGWLRLALSRKARSSPSEASKMIRQVGHPADTGAAGRGRVLINAQMSAFGGEAEILCSTRALPVLTDAVEKIGDGGVRLLLELLMVSFWPRSIAYLSGGCGTRPTEDAT